MSPLKSINLTTDWRSHQWDQYAADPDMTGGFFLSRAFSYLGGALQLIHGRVVGWLAGGTFGGTDEFRQSFGHVAHRIYQNHLRGR